MRSFFPQTIRTGITSLTLRFLLLKCQMIVCPSLLHSCVLETNFSPLRTPGEIMSFGVSPVNYSDSELFNSLTKGVFETKTYLAFSIWQSPIHNSP